MTPLRALILGIDGADPDLLNRWIGECRLPVLASLRASGAWGTIRSTLPCSSPAVWSSLMTGVNPAKHGIFGFFRIHPGTGERTPTLPEDLRSAPFWAAFRRAGLRTGIADFPYADPEQVGDGFFLGVQLGGRRRMEARPPSLALALEREFPRMLIDVYWQGVAEKMASPESFLKDLDRLTDERSRLIARSLEREPCEVLAVVLGGVDRLQHAFWRWMDPAGFETRASDVRSFGGAIRSYYERVDSLLGDWLSRWCDERTHVLVVSDHGFGPLRGEIHLNNWLRDRGYLRLRASAPPPAPFPTATLRNKWGRALPESIKAAIRPWLPSRPPPTPPAALPDHPEWIDWTRTRALAFGGGTNGIYLNVPPLFPGGAFTSEDEIDEFRRSLREELRDLTVPGSAAPLFRRVLPADDDLVGPYLNQSPHLRLEGNETEVVDLLSDGPWYDPAPNASGRHRPEGIFCLRSPAVRPGPLAAPLQMVDVAPVLLTAMRLAVPAQMDGEPPPSLFRNGVEWRRGPPDPPPNAPDRAPRTDEEIALVRNELRRLGYLRN